MENTADTSVTAAQRTQFFRFLNETQTDSLSASRNQFFTDGNNLGLATSGSTLNFVPGGSKYTDARFVLRADGADYDRIKVKAATGLLTADASDNTTISNFPRKANSIYGYTADGTPTGALVTPEPNTVFNRLKAHVAPYTPAVVADITGVSEVDQNYLVDAYIANSRCSMADALAVQDPRVAGYKAVTMLYAMGLTQHTCGAQNVKAFAVLQTITGNVGRAGGGINALRGIHNVQGSTDQGLLFGNIPYYSGNPTKMTAGGTYGPHGAGAFFDAALTDPVNDANAFGKYLDTLWGVPVSGTGGRTNMNGSYDDAYNLTAGILSLQQRGFMNMTYNFFGGGTAWMTEQTALTIRNFTNGLYDLWPKGNGDDHITMFRKAITGETKAMVVWGQNPAVTEPNLSKIRDGLHNLDTLVVADMFASETAMVSRKATGTTYLIPASSHVEEAGSTANSGRVLQWRERATLPKGKSKADLELLFRLAHALDAAGAFSHITARWTALGKTGLTAYAVLYGTRYGWTPTDATAFEAVSGTAEIWRGAETAPRAPGLVHGSEWFCEQLYRELNTPTTGISWLYTGAYSTTRTTNKHLGQVDWQTDNRSKSRNTADPNSTLAFPSWGYSWLVNRRVLYNNGDVPGDVLDFYMSTESVSRLFTSTNRATMNYARWYRTVHRLADMPDVALGGPTAAHVLAGRFPGHTEPYETPRADLALVWGRNTKGTAPWDLIKADSNVAAPGRSHNAADFPFVLTTIRCVEHFQGGPTTRNNPWNVETEPEPWVEINSVDAANLGISDGEYVNIVTARANSMGTLARETAFPAAGWAKGFKARVGAGTLSNQRVGPGVVAIPWHWGDQGLSKGSRANDLCIDATDANTVIPEYKACLCNLVKIP